ncbi:MAG: Hsp33 family molecular chaperone HslO [Myxococcales bacterium]|nr:Hsp33 family molecular chaperone HslO [Myxococcales bacterium]MCB9644487.1 Hsp33 family molecular chaperone HslO [Myxococcales bacterium]
MSQDRLMKVLAYDGQVRAYVCQTTELVSEMCKRHDTWPNASVALGRALSAGVMMAGMLKEEQHQLALEFRGDGPIGRVVVDARADGTARGYVGNPHVGHPNGEPGTINVGDIVGRDGFLHVLRDTEEEELYRGTVPMINGEISSDLTYYFAQSEQTPTVVGVGVLLHEDGSVSSSGGFLVQLMPDASDEVASKLEHQIEQLESVVRRLEGGVSMEEIMHDLLGSDYNILEERPLRFRCTCSRPRVERALLSLGIEELNDMLNEQGEAETFCDFCRERYYFGKEDLQMFIRVLEKSLQM